MDEAQPRGTAERRDDGVGDAVHALCCRCDALVGGVPGGEVVAVVVPAVPGDARAGGLAFVAVLEASALHAQKLLPGTADGVFVRESQPVHGAGHFQTGPAVRPGGGLGLDQT